MLLLPEKNFQFSLPPPPDCPEMPINTGVLRGGSDLFHFHLTSTFLIDFAQNSRFWGRNRRGT